MTSCRIERCLRGRNSLRRSYALATADTVDGTLLVGADNDFDELEDDGERFRDEPA